MKSELWTFDFWRRTWPKWLLNSDSQPFTTENDRDNEKSPSKCRTVAVRALGCHLPYTPAPGGCAVEYRWWMKDYYSTHSSDEFEASGG